MMPACGSANIPDCLFSALRYALARLMNLCSSAGYDEPAILSYAISSFCPTSADGLHAIDVQVPGMIYGAILRSPVEGGAPDQINDAAARAVTGVTDGSTPHQAWRGAFG